jgi:hypothetical protein
MRSLIRVLSTGLLVLAANACTKTETVTETVTKTVEVPVCPSSQTKCGDLCVSTKTDNLNCGECGNACAAGSVCNGDGVCALSCQEGLVACGGTCTDPMTSRTHCGAKSDCTGENAGELCGDGEICDNGECKASCADKLVACDGTCVDPKTDVLHCGAGSDCSSEPGVTCSGGEHAAPACVDGGCRIVCDAGYADCDGVAANGCETQGICAGACTFRDAEHPSYTTTAQDVALCGNYYDESNIASACAVGWHVCKLSEWKARYPAGQAPGGTLTTWGAPQSERCTGTAGMWEAGRPTNGDTWDEDVCIDPNDASVASYNPWNDGKFLFDDDGSTILQGDGECCDWDSDFAPATITSGFAVYCCR